MSDQLPVICLAGPTGSGKTALALQLAHSLHAEIINADSRQVYRDFPIITAQPLPEERAACPHHLYGFLDSREKISAGQWLVRAVEKIQELRGRGVRALLVGGTGLYFRALLEGMAEIPPVDPALTQALTRECARLGPAALYRRLQTCDPAYAAKIHPNDRQRIVRALEVCQSTGKAFSWWHQHSHTPAPCTGPLLGLHMTLEDLTPRLCRRIDAMLEAGALEEARTALRHCPDPHAPAWSGIGCAELFRYLRGELSLEAAKQLWAHNTRAYAKRQLTWFRAVPHIHWLDHNALYSALEYIASTERAHNEAPRTETA